MLSDITIPAPGFLSDGVIELHRFEDRHFSEHYLRWLNDPEVNRYSQRSGMVTGEAAARDWLRSLPVTTLLLAIECAEDGRHVGNITCGPIDSRHKLSDISILLGEKDVWGRGYGRRALKLATNFLFVNVGLNRVEAGSANPAFIKSALNLGWKIEGCQRQARRVGDQYLDWTLMALLSDDYLAQPRK